MQTLKLPDYCLPLIHSGVKKMTILEGFQEVGLGQLLLEPTTEDGEAPVEVKVGSVFFMPFERVPLNDIQPNGETNHSALLLELQEVYPTMQLTSDCTVVCWQ